MIISIDGIIGAGKSTILDLLKRRGKSVFFEPFANNPILPRFYENPERFAAITQAVFFPIRADLHLSIPSQGTHFIERSCYSDRFSFGELLRLKMEPEEWLGYCIFFSLLTRKFNLLPDLTLIIDETPEICLERIRKRGRKMEEGITLSYLRDLRKMYFLNLQKLGKSAYVFGNNDMSDFPLDKDISKTVDTIIEIQGAEED